MKELQPELDPLPSLEQEPLEPGLTQVVKGGDKNSQVTQRTEMTLPEEPPEVKERDSFEDEEARANHHHHHPEEDQSEPEPEPEPEPVELDRVDQQRQHHQQEGSDQGGLV